MCRLAVGYHYICPLPIRGASQGGCGKKFFAALDTVPEWAAIRDVLDVGTQVGRTQTRQYLRDKTYEAPYQGPAWDGIRSGTLEDICDKVTCKLNAHLLDRWDYWAPSEEDFYKGKGKEAVFQEYCPKCSPHVRGRARLPSSAPEKVPYEHPPFFKIGKQLFDDPYWNYTLVEDDVWRAPEEMDENCELEPDDSSEVSRAESGTTESSVAFTIPSIKLPPRRRRTGRGRPSKPLPGLQERSSEDDDDDDDDDDESRTEVSCVTDSDASLLSVPTQEHQRTPPPRPSRKGKGRRPMHSGSGTKGLHDGSMRQMRFDA